ncbi:cobalamin B12-binding domain-containing protein [Streptacidiphilus sp. PAMC 29251]
MAPRQWSPSSERPRRVVLSTIPSDSHTWNLLFLQLLLEEHGCAVTNLGACVPVETLVAESVRQLPDLVVVSTVNGHGLHEGLDIAGSVRARKELKGVPLVIGGKIDTSGSQSAADFGPLLAAGFDAVLVGAGAVPDLLSLLDGLPRAVAVGARWRAYADAHA